MNERNILIPENFDVYEAAEFRQEVNYLISEGEKQFIFDFSNCTFIDTTGLGVLVLTHKACMELNGSIKLLSKVKISQCEKVKSVITRYSKGVSLCH